MPYATDWHHDRTERIPISQTEPGYTLIHIHVIPAINTIPAIWYHFEGTYLGQPTLSTSPDFLQETPPEVLALLFCEYFTWLGISPPPWSVLLFSEPFTWLGYGPPPNIQLILTEHFSGEHPSCSTEEPEYISSTSAKLIGFLADPGESVCNGRFQWRKLADPDWSTTPWQSRIPSGQYFSAWITNLAPDTEYCYRAEVYNGVYYDHGAVVEFKTLP
ncbi:MAG: hypothetical protein Q7T55_02260, partial [Solirubrobacteraceae bacterium]|nr:hypothetical protein [Solirubrobacteraceae bacterium]